MNVDVKLTAVYLQVPEGYIGFVEELPGANTQGATLEATKANLEEAIHLVLEANLTLSPSYRRRPVSSAFSHGFRLEARRNDGQ